MELPEDRYELYLTRDEYTELSELDLSDIPELRGGVRTCVAGNEDVCIIFPDIRCMVRVARELDHIPVHYHTRLAEALRNDGWTATGRLSDNDC